MISSVYEVVQQSSDARYIGLTTRELHSRWRAHVTQAARKPKGRLQRAIRQCGESDFEIRVRAELPTAEEAQIAERILIALERPALNALAGGEHIRRVGAKHTESSRAAIGDANRGKTLSVETRELIGAAHRGKPGPKPTAETRTKLSAAQQGNTKMLGKTHSVETRAKMSAARTAWHAAKKATTAA